MNDLMNILMINGCIMEHCYSEHGPVLRSVIDSRVCATESMNALPLQAVLTVIENHIY